MNRLLVSDRAGARQRWADAFPDATAVADLAACAGNGADSLWLDLTGLEGEARMARVAAGAALGAPVIAMAPVPSEADAFALLASGARGYCHLEAAPAQLREIALVVEHGGLWMPPHLLGRFLGVALRAGGGRGTAVPGLENLTTRELAVARLVARGGSNREIAEELEVSERTVKAHLTAIFDKLGVRDRVQLALAMNNVST